MKLKVFLIIVFYSVTAYPQKSGTFIDERDGNEYRWVRIGQQTWMQENLSFETKKGSWVNDDITTQFLSPFHNKKYDQKLYEIYGRLYNWKMANEVCPEGWHLPSDEEWIQLEISIGMSEEIARSTEDRTNDFASCLKAQEGWGYKNLLKERSKKDSLLELNYQDPRARDMNTYGFTALPGGARLAGFITPSYAAAGMEAHFWTSTKNGSRYYTRSLYNGNIFIERRLQSKKRGLSVRCVKNAP